jgi:hypothetical protein
MVGTTWSVASERSLRIDTPEGACNGTVANCALPINQVVFAGSHNAMSSSLTGEWLFPEHNPSILNQLRSGVRALLIDTHLGFPTTVRIPGFRGTLVSTDRAGAQTVPGAEPLDPAADARGRELAAQVAGSTTATSQMYLCHNYCELGSVPFSSALRDINRFLDANPGEVVMLLIQDAVDPVRTVAAFDAAGITKRAATLTLGQPLPTLGELVDSGHQLIVFNETSGTGGPPWYHHMYDGWFGETKFGVRSIDAFTCDPNRGSTDAPFFLLNHWVTFSPPDQGRAAQVNGDSFLTDRLRLCAQERGRVPNVVAVDFEDRGALFIVIDREADELRRIAAG